MNGVININKPLGKTSHDIVNIVRKALNMKRVGHTGTLDPNASGVLPICVGKATRAAEMLTGDNKAYRAVVKLGSFTDTQDATGEILSEFKVSVSELDINSVISDFIGEIEQIPPMFSAIKINGEKLYNLARKGISVERKPRRIKIYNINILKIDLKNNLIEISVECSKGTYIRTLCNDIGEGLGCGAHMHSLERTRSGIFKIADSITLEHLWECAENNTLNEIITPIDALFGKFPKLVVDKKEEEWVRNGRAIPVKNLMKNVTYRVYGSDGCFLCLSKPAEENIGLLKLERAFY